MSVPVPMFTNDDEAAQHWLTLLRDGHADQKIQAREQLATIFERRGMFEEAAELLQANYMAGSRTLPLFRSLMRIYVKRGDEDAVRWAMQQAFETVRPSLPPPVAVGPLRPGACDGCGASLGIRDKLAGRPTCRTCIQWREEVWAAQCAAYAGYLQTVVGRDDEQYGLSFELSQLKAFLGISTDAARDLHQQAFNAYVDRALADDRLTEDEEERLYYLMHALGFDDDVLEDIQDWPFRYLVSRANAGRLTDIGDCQLILKPGEMPYLELLVSLMKERVIMNGSRDLLALASELRRGFDSRPAKRAEDPSWSGHIWPLKIKDNSRSRPDGLCSPERRGASSIRTRN
jgi:hypothetical protein